MMALIRGTKGPQHVTKGIELQVPKFSGTYSTVFSARFIVTEPILSTAMREVRQFLIRTVNLFMNAHAVGMRRDEAANTRSTPGSMQS